MRDQKRHSLRLRWNGIRVLAALLLLTLTSALSSVSNAQENTQQSTLRNAANSAAIAQDAVESDDDKQERVVAERFLELLQKRPRPGTALDKVYGYYLQQGTLNKFCDDLREKATANSGGESWLLLGLVQSQRGRDSDALVALQKADELLSDDAMASYYYGKSLAMIGNAEQAVAAMDRAIQRKPAKAEMLLILQDLGRLYQRMGRATEATDVWKNLEQSFPGDARVKEQIASILAEEGK